MRPWAREHRRQPDPSRGSRYSTFGIGGHGRRREPQSNNGTTRSGRELEDVENGGGDAVQCDAVPGTFGPAQRTHLAAPHPRHEQQSSDHRIDPSSVEGDPGRTRHRAPAAAAAIRGGRRSAGSRRAPRAVRSPAELGRPASFARKHAAATAIEALEYPPYR